MDKPKIAAVFLFFLALVVIFTYPISLEPHRLAANDGDPLHISWILAWDAHQIVRNPLRLFESNSFYPYRNSLAFSEHMIVQGLLAAPFYCLSGNALLAQNLIVFLTLTLSGWAMFLLVREILGNEDAALVAGVLYVFHTYAFHEIPRLQLLSIQWWPLAALYLHRFFMSRQKKNGVLFAFFFLLQGLSCTYYLIYFALALVLWIPVYFLFVGRDLRAVAYLVVPLGLAGAFLGLMALPYFGVLKSFGYGRPLAEGVDLLEYVRPPDWSFFSQWVEFGFDRSIVPHFLGFVAPTLALLGLLALIRTRLQGAARTFVWLSVTTASLGLVLSLGPTIRMGDETIGAGPYSLLYNYLPFFRVLRNPERLSPLVHFGIAVLGALAVASVLQRLPRQAARWVFGTTLIVLPFEHFSGGQPHVTVPTGREVPEVYRWLGERSGHDPVVELPVYPRRRHRLHALYNFYSTYHWKPFVFGRTSFYPPLVEYLAWELRDFPDNDSVELLRFLGVRTVVVHPWQWPESERGQKLAELRGMTDRLQLAGRFAGLPSPHQERFGFGDERVYLVREGPPPPMAELCFPVDEIEPTAWQMVGSGITPTEWAYDRDPATKWRTKKQLPGDYLLLDLGRYESISALRMPLTYPYHEFPRHLILRARNDEGRFQRVDYRQDIATKVEVVRSLVNHPRDAALTLRLDSPGRARWLRFVVGGSRWEFALPPWALSELHIYRSCELR